LTQKHLTVVATVNFHAGINEFLQLYFSVPGRRYTAICEHWHFTR